MSEPIPCIFCVGIEMEEVATPDNARSIERIGITAYGGNKWRVLRCPSCGNVQLFLVER